MRRLDGIADSMNMSLSKLWEMVIDRKAQPASVHGVAKSNWRTTTIIHLPRQPSPSVIYFIVVQLQGFSDSWKELWDGSRGLFYCSRGSPHSRCPFQYSFHPLNKHFSRVRSRGQKTEAQTCFKDPIGHLLQLSSGKLSAGTTWN